MLWFAGDTLQLWHCSSHMLAIHYVMYFLHQSRYTEKFAEEKDRTCLSGRPHVRVRKIKVGRHTQKSRERRVSHGITRQRDHAAYSKCMRSFVDEMCSIPLTFHREKMLIRQVLTAGATGCENPLSAHIDSHSECFSLIYLFLFWGLCEMLHFIRKWKKCARKLDLKRQR